jgi:hypothetical protein
METAMQQHINWLKGCIELLDEQAPIMEKTLMLCLKDAESRLDAEKEQKYSIDFIMWYSGMDKDKIENAHKRWINETFKSE